MRDNITTAVCYACMYVRSTVKFLLKSDFFPWAAKQRPISQIFLDCVRFPIASFCLQSSYLRCPRAASCHTRAALTLGAWPPQPLGQDVGRRVGGTAEVAQAGEGLGGDHRREK